MKTEAIVVCGLLLLSCSQSPTESEPAHSLRVHSPNGGEVFRPGETVQAKFSGDAGENLLAVVQWSWDGGRHWLTMDETVAVEGTVTVNYVVPDTIHYFEEVNGSIVDMTASPVSDRWMLLVYDYDRGSSGVRDTSDGLFSVKE